MGEPVEPCSGHSVMLSRQERIPEQEARRSSLASSQPFPGKTSASFPTELGTCLACRFPKRVPFIELSGATSYLSGAMAERCSASLARNRNLVREWTDGERCGASAPSFDATAQDLKIQGDLPVECASVTMERQQRRVRASGNLPLRSHLLIRIGVLA